MNGKTMRYNIASGLFRTTRVMTDSRAPDWKEYQEGRIDGKTHTHEAYSSQRSNADSSQLPDSQTQSGGKGSTGEVEGP